MSDRFNRVLGDTVEAMEEAGLRYVFIGGIASGGLGRPRSTHDIDVFVKPEDAELTLRALAKKGFRTEKTDPFWLYKGFKENILVDVIFKSKGEIYLDTEMYQRSITAEFHGKQLKLVAPEDLVIIEAAAHSELTPGHWHDALALLTHATIDWDYLIRRARRAPRRVLSLLIYAQSADIWVPKNVVEQLYQVCFGDLPPGTLTASSPQQGATAPQTARVGAAAIPSKQVPLQAVPSHSHPNHHAIAKLREHLAEDSRTNELDIQIEEVEGKFLLRGEVMTKERKASVEQIAREMYPSSKIENQIRVLNFSEPVEAEEIK